MLRWALAFLVLTITAGLIGFGGISSGLAVLAQIMFVIFSALLLIFLVASLIDQAEHPRDLDN